MPFVLDASMTMSWCFADESSPSTQGVLRQIKETYVEVPAVWPLEIANVLAMGERRRRLTRVMADESLQLISRLDIRVQGPQPSHLLLALARRYSLSAYDATYLELSQRRNLAIATLDENLKRAAQAAGILLLG